MTDVAKSAWARYDADRDAYEQHNVFYMVGPNGYGEAFASWHKVNGVSKLVWYARVTWMCGTIHVEYAGPGTLPTVRDKVREIAAETGAKIVDDPWYAKRLVERKVKSNWNRRTG